MRNLLEPSYANHKLAKEIEDKRAQLATPTTLFHVSGTCVTSTIVYFLFKDNTSTEETIFWFSAFFANLSLYSFLWATYYFHPTLIEKKTRKRLNILVMFMFGMSWAISPWIFIDSPVLTDIFILTVVLFSMCVIAGPALCLMSFPGYIFFCTPVLIGGCIRIYMVGAPIPTLAYALVPFLWASIIAHSYGAYKMYISSIQVDLEKQEALTNEEIANEEKSRFIAAASHDIRQPLQAITYLIEQLHQKAPESISDIVKNLDESTSSMSTLLDGLLDISKLDAGAIKPSLEYFDIKDLIERICHDNQGLAEHKNLFFNHEVTSHVVHTDKLILGRILSNLINNAIKYTNHGGVTIKIESHTNNSITISIEDTGIGIPKDQIDHIYKEFYQIDNPELNQKKGLGLGLSIVQRLSRIIDLELDVHSEPEQGTIFSFHIPTHPEHTLETTSSPDKGPIQKLDTLRVLLVDDNEAIRHSLAELLNEWGCRVTTADDLETAIEITKNYDKDFQLIITDYRLPDGKTGSDVIQAVHDIQENNIPSIIITGDTSVDRIKDAERSSTMLLHKPVKPAMLKVAVSRVIDWT